MANSDASSTRTLLPDHAAENGVVAANLIPVRVVVNTGGDPGRCRFLLMVW